MKTDIEMHAEYQKAQSAILAAVAKAAGDNRSSSAHELAKAYRALAEGYAWNSNPDQPHG